MLIRMFLFFAVSWFLVGCTRVDENPVQMQSLVCDGEVVVPKKYTHVEGYRDVNVWAQDAYIAIWKLPKECQKVTILNTLGDTLWESETSVVGDVSMLRTTHPHTISIASSQ